jgi:hypothetical protein
MPMTATDVLVQMAAHQRVCDVCRAFDRPGGADRSKNGLPQCRTYSRLHAKWQRVRARERAKITSGGQSVCPHCNEVLEG